MQVIIKPTAEAACRLAVQLIADQVKCKPSSVLGLATGGTMEAVYGALARMHQEDALDFSLVRTFNLDEYVGLAPEHPCSYRQYMNEQLFDHINIDPRNTHLPLGTAPDLRAECRQYEQDIEDCGGIDLQLLGIGRSGHIGFNEPLSALQSRTRDKALTPTTLQQNAPLFPTPEDMPRRGITMGVGTILDSKHCLMLVTGTAKADVLAKAVEGPITSMISATALQLHPNCQVIVDADAGQALTQHDYYNWIFQNEPEWEPYRDLV